MRRRFGFGFKTGAGVGFGFETGRGFGWFSGDVTEESLNLCYSCVRQGPEMFPRLERRSGMFPCATF